MYDYLNMETWVVFSILLVLFAGFGIARNEKRELH